METVVKKRKPFGFYVCSLGFTFERCSFYTVKYMLAIWIAVTVGKGGLTMPKQFIAKNTLYRLPLYLSFLKCLPPEIETISATCIAEELGFNHVQARKDLASVSDRSRPKVGYKTVELVADLERFFLRKISDNAVIVGMGPLGHTMALFSDYKAFGFEIV